MYVLSFCLFFYFSNTFNILSSLVHVVQEPHKTKLFTHVITSLAILSSYLVTLLVTICLKSNILLSNTIECSPNFYLEKFLSKLIFTQYTLVVSYVNDQIQLITGKTCNDVRIVLINIKYLRLNGREKQCKMC